MSRAVTGSDALPGDILELLRMLQHRRPAKSPDEAAFVARYVAPLGTVADAYGNHWLTIGSSPVLFSCHTDTVHRAGGKQKIQYGLWCASVAKASGSNCLGADCTTGVWLMRAMIHAGVPGTYVFHRDEEVGGLGSGWIAKHTPERLAGVKFAIAFDRKGTSEIITHQMGYRCASEAFANSLSDILRPLALYPSDGGTFTDTANYEAIVPECTNISVGYHDQHQAKEWQDVAYARTLRDALIAADWDALVCDRDPRAYEQWDDVRDERGFALHFGGKDGGDKLVDYVRSNVHEVAAFLEDLGYGPRDVEAFLYARAPF